MKKQSFWEITRRTEPDLIDQLLKNRGIDTADREKFFNPKLTDLRDPLKLPGVKEARDRILSAIKTKEKIVIYGDYDVDGITATAVLWEAIASLGGKVMPYIPNRFSEGYGVNADAVEKLAAEGNKLIISVDSGVRSFDEVALANKLGVDFIVTDHHVLPEKLPPALAVVHTTELAGVGVAYTLARTLVEKPALELVALGTIADIVPLVGDNRILAKFGMEELKKTNRPGLLALYEEAGIDRRKIGVYEVGFILDPRLNAMGRLESAMDSLRILLTKDPVRARDLARKLGATNDERRRKTLEMVDHARSAVGDGFREKLWVVSHSSYEQGIIGLIAGRLCEEWSRPVIAIAEDKEFSKGSARSIEAFNVVLAIESAKDLLVAYGGHPQAAGFTIETRKIPEFRNRLQEYIETKVKEEDLQKKLVIDAEVKPSEITANLAKQLEDFSPTGIGNPTPLFVAKNLEVGAMRLLSENRHLRVDLGGIEAIGFGMGERGAEIRPGMKIDAIFHIEMNSWQDRERLQLKLRDFKVSG